MAARRRCSRKPPEDRDELDELAVPLDVPDLPLLRIPLYGIPRSL
jgi:hypothetical protein